MKHVKVSSGIDDGNPNKIQPSDWNAEHVFDTIAVSAGAVTPVPTAGTGAVAYSSTLGKHVYWTGGAWQILGGSGGGGGYTRSITAPTSPAEGDVWFDLNTGITWTWTGDGDSFAWVEFSTAVFNLVNEEPKIGTIVFAQTGVYPSSRYIPCDGVARLKSTFPLIGATQADALMTVRHVNSYGDPLGITFYHNGYCYIADASMGLYRVASPSLDSYISTPSNLAIKAFSGKGNTLVGLHTGSAITSYSTDNGVTWVSGAITSSSWGFVATNGTVFVASTTGATACATSTDGITWTAQAGLGMATLGLFHTGSLFVAYNATTVKTSTDGITWTTRTLQTINTNTNTGPVDSPFSIICMTGNTNILLAFSNTASRDRYQYSEDGGVTWTVVSPNTGIVNLIIQIANYNPTLGMFIAINTSGRIITSLDGKVWRGRVYPDSNTVSINNNLAPSPSGWLFTIGSILGSFVIDSTKFEVPYVAGTGVTGANPLLRVA